MRPYCTHQKALGWDNTANIKVNFSVFTLKSDVITEKNKVEKEVLDYAKRGIAYKTTDVEMLLLNLDYYAVTNEPEKHKVYLEKYYNLCKDIKTITLGWLCEGVDGVIYHSKYDIKHVDGILSKPCPECGYKYGSSWLKEEIPSDVIEWLDFLPISVYPSPWKTF
jgi:hypothetical protein